MRVSQVRNFVKHARDSGYEPEAFLDAARETEEARQKWRVRREKEVRRGRKDVMMNSLEVRRFECTTCRHANH